MRTINGVDGGGLSTIRNVELTGGPAVVSVQRVRPISPFLRCDVVDHSPYVLSQLVALRREENGCLSPLFSMVRAKLVFLQLARPNSMSASRSAVFGYGRGLPFDFYTSVQRGPILYLFT